MYKSAVPVPMDNTNKRMKGGHCWSLMLIPERAKHRRSLRIGRWGALLLKLLSLASSNVLSTHMRGEVVRTKTVAATGQPRTLGDPQGGQLSSSTDFQEIQTRMIWGKDIIHSLNAFCVSSVILLARPTWHRRCLNKNTSLN